MLFLFKPKPITIDAFISIPIVHELFPIKKATSDLPEWWKQYPSKIPFVNEGFPDHHDTIKRCDALIDLYKTALILPMWTDCKIKTQADGGYSWKYSAAVGYGCDIKSHPRIQYGPTFDEYIHFKINSPWVVKEKTGVKFYFTQPFWHQINTKYKTAPGIVDYKLNNGTHVNIFADRKDSLIEINAGDPLAYIIPLSDKEVNIKCHLVSREEYVQLWDKYQYNWTFHSKTKKIKRMQKEQTTGKCPFGFGK